MSRGVVHVDDGGGGRGQSSGACSCWSLPADMFDFNQQKQQKQQLDQLKTKPVFSVRTQSASWTEKGTLVAVLDWPQECRAK